MYTEPAASLRAQRTAPPPPLRFGSVSLDLFQALVEGTLPAGLYAADAAAAAVREAAAGGAGDGRGAGAAGEAPALLSIPDKYCPGSWMVRPFPADQFRLITVDLCALCTAQSPLNGDANTGDGWQRHFSEHLRGTALLP